MASSHPACFHYLSSYAILSAVLMNTVTGIIAAEINNQAARFVFPSETASSAWAREALFLTRERSVAAGRFLAWDRFKETVIRAELADKKPVSSVLRKLFAESLLRRNAGEKFFTSLIPPGFAGEGGVFSRELAAALPSLALWESLAAARGSALDAEDADLALLKKEYGDFLASKKLFEPSWVKPPFRDREHTYYIFFPEAMEDFTEYAELLENEKNIRIVRAAKDAEPPELFLYASALTEIRAAVQEMLRLREEEGIPYGEMAVSVPRLEDMEPCLMRELALANIPARRRSGKPLAEYGAGNIFSLMGACAADGFTFSSLKALLLDDRLPWQNPEMNRSLIDFGARQNCVCGYRDEGRRVDVWEEAFRSAGGGGELGGYYHGLRRHIASLASSRNFAEIRGRFFGLYPAFLSREKTGEEAAAILTRCMEELSSLIQITSEHPGLVPASPYGFFLSLLREINYVEQAEGTGVNIFPYRVAAASPFAAHFVLNASQEAATILYRPLKFLRQDKRGRLGLGDTDASEVFFRLYAHESRGKDTAFFRISASSKTFAGWAIPHSYFSGRTQEDAAQATDLFTREREWWANGGEFPPCLFPVQKESFAAWQSSLAAEAPEKFNLLRRPFPKQESLAALERRIREIQWDSSREAALDRKTRAASAAEERKYIRVSATALTEFFRCPASWLMKEVFRLEPFSLEAQLLDGMALGILYHRILEKLFTRIREEDKVFKPEHIEAYCAWAREYTDLSAKERPAFQGPLAVPLVASQTRMLTRKIRALLRMEAKYFPAYAVSDFIEKELAFIRGDAVFLGKIDRVSLSPAGEPIIIDYKTGAPPTAESCTEKEGSPLEDFQAAMYVRLFEEEKGVPVAGVYFFSINRGSRLGVFARETKTSSATPRELYQPTMDALDTYAERFARALRELDFSAQGVRYAACADCAYKTICRRTYALNAAEGGAS
ncbi:MAG: PD-(D/E)XK nuclease family protein [Spirochaetaceae bacterium]|nr:PD-(D/E)XK nuclease family protein [Spirochaetaceae bacterium]